MARYKRCKILFGEDGFSKIQRAKILILGVGGVGSYVLDCLYRSGISDITVVDYDIYDESNRNRQIGSDNNIGRLKTETLKIIYPNIKTINQKIDIKWVANFDFEPFDIIIDSTDTSRIKVELAKKNYKKLIMSMGAGKRVDASKIEVTSIWKTYGDRLARKVRNRLKKEKFNRNFLTVFSPEEDICKENGSFVGVTGTFGLMICSETIKRILGR